MRQKNHDDVEDKEEEEQEDEYVDENGDYDYDNEDNTHDPQYSINTSKGSFPSRKKIIKIIFPRAAVSSVERRVESWYQIISNRLWKSLC